MKSVPRISDAEWEIMLVIWQNGAPLTSQEIIDSVAKQQNWNPKTVRTLLNRLLKKGALSFQKQGRVYQYSACVSKEACVGANSDSFLDRMFDGSLKPMLAHFIQEKQLTKAEIADLKRMLDGKE